MATEYTMILTHQLDELPEVMPVPTMTVAAWKQLMGNLRKVGMQALTWDRFSLSIRARNALAKKDIRSVFDAWRMSRAEVESIPWCGRKVRSELYDTVRETTGITLEHWRN